MVSYLPSERKCLSNPVTGLQRHEIICRSQIDMRASRFQLKHAERTQQCGKRYEMGCPKMSFLLLLLATGGKSLWKGQNSSTPSGLGRSQVTKAGLPELLKGGVVYMKA